MTNKLYADGNGTEYTYTPEGKLNRRTWARGVTTDYSYDPATGEMTNINYSGSTPDISFTYDRMGRQETVTDAEGTRTFSYDGDTLELTNETIVTQEDVTNIIVRSYDGYGRPAGLSLTIAGASEPQYVVSYSHSDEGRFCCVTSVVESVTNVFMYSYENDSDLVAGWIATNPASGFSLSVTRGYENNRNLITNVVNATNGAAMSSYLYDNDEIGRRTNRIDNVVDTIITNSYAYDMRSQLTNAVLASASKTNAFVYVFDNIGNRDTYRTNSTTWTYQPNQLNQYTNIANGVTNTPSYDADGNLTGYGDIYHEWSGENRPLGTHLDLDGDGYGSAGDRYIWCTYDYMGRRTSKVYYLHNGSTWDITGTNQFIYDGWNLIAEIQDETAGGGSVTTNYFINGLDLSGSMQGAGGIGGLVATVRDGETYFVTYDANGNVSEYVSTNGTVAAAYQYSPFGRVTGATGAKKDDFPHRFSTKYTDDETGLLYYGRRYYSPELGRWVRRNPVERNGGAVYVFVYNAPVNWTTPKGVTPVNDGIGQKKKQTFSLKPVIDDGPSPGDCGKIGFFIHWRIEPIGQVHPQNGGYVHQKVTFTWKVEEQDFKTKKVSPIAAMKFTSPLIFYEVWRVEAGGKRILPYNSDEFAWSGKYPKGGDCTRGKVSIIAVAEYHDNVASVPSHMQSMNKETTAGILKSSRQDPKLGGNLSNTVAHELVFHWDCFLGTKNAKTIVDSHKP